HPGKMVQMGLNAGPRHARILGWAKSYTKKLTPQAQEDHDRDVIGATGIVWSLIKSVAPVEIMEYVDQCLEEEDMPRMATRSIPEGDGFCIKADGITYKLSDTERSPPEAYMSRGYIA
ncbi:hypothetical protein DENSPDRAFT_789943, partial [Dentipellis sp. KUC8613]